MTLSRICWVALGGAAGAVLRYVIGHWIVARFGATFPWHTLVINVTGSFVLGFLYGLSAGRIPETARVAVGVGVLGAYTTFSTFEYELLQMAEQGRALQAGGYMLASLVLGFAAVWAGAAFAGRR